MLSAGSGASEANSCDWPRGVFNDRVARSPIKLVLRRGSSLTPCQGRQLLPGFAGRWTDDGEFTAFGLWP